MSARQEDRIDLILPAYVAEMIFLVCMLELHRSLAETFSLFEAASIDIAMFDVYHSALTVGLVGCPFACVAVAVCVFHGSPATFPARNKIAIVSITGQGDQDSVAVGSATFEGVGFVAEAEIRAVRFVAEVGGVVEAAEEVEEVDGISTLAFGLERRDRARIYERVRYPGQSHQQTFQGMEGKSAYFSPRGRRWAMNILPSPPLSPNRCLNVSWSPTISLRPSFKCRSW